MILLESVSHSAYLRLPLPPLFNFSQYTQGSTKKDSESSRLGGTPCLLVLGTCCVKQIKLLSLLEPLLIGKMRTAISQPIEL